jgi:endonuclease YncB( thermonuclease family)
MKKIITILTALSCSIAFANPYDYKVTRIIDGDTVEFEAPFLPAPLKPKLSIRVLGIDTPEKGHRAQCPKEAEAALKASAFTKDKIAKAKKIQIELKDHDKYGGRVLGDVIIDGQRLSELLIANGHARPYHGEKKASWCD